MSCSTRERCFRRARFTCGGGGGWVGSRGGWERCQGVVMGCVRGVVTGCEGCGDGV